MTYRILFFGMFGEFSLSTLRGLLADSSATVCGAVTFDATAYTAEPRLIAIPKGFSLTLLPRTDLLALTADHDLPLYAISSFDYLDFVRDLQPDLIVTACFPKLFPPALLAIPKVGCLNLHPSLLPNYRGVAPLFWQFYYGETQTGVTLHFMDESADTGDMVAQTKVKFADGLTSLTIEQLTAKAGVSLLADALTHNPIPRSSQKADTAVRYARAPRPADLVIPTSWGARRAFNFMRGANEWSPFWIETPEGRYRASAALAYAIEPPSAEATALVVNGERRIRFADGYVVIRS